MRAPELMHIRAQEDDHWWAMHVDGIRPLAAGRDAAEMHRGYGPFPASQMCITRGFAQAGRPSKRLGPSPEWSGDPP